MPDDTSDLAEHHDSTRQHRPRERRHTGPRRPAIFLDRDGTILVERDYLSDPAEAVLLPGAAPALRRLAASGYALVVVTNQSGIARGLLTAADFHAVQRRLAELLAAEDVVLDGTYWCPHHPDFTGPCACRKPGVALHEAAVRELELDLARSFFIGDRVSDVLPALRLGGRGILVRTGYGAGEQKEVPAGVAVVGDLGDAAERIVTAAPHAAVQAESQDGVDTSGSQA